MNDIYIFMIAGGVIVLLTVFVINFVTQNWLLAFLLVKISRGRKVLVEVLGATRSYFVVGTPSEGELVYKDASKERKRTSVNAGNFIRRWGIESAYVDEENNAIIDFRSGFAAVQGYDNSDADRLVSRIIARKLDDKMKSLILIGLVIAVLVSLAGAYYAYSNSNAIAEIPSLLRSVMDVCSENVV